MIILDVETTGINPYKNSIVSIGAIEFENPSNKIYLECRPFDNAVIEDAALKVNGYTREQLLDQNRMSLKDAITSFIQYVDKIPNKIISGQNVFFDMSFLKCSIELYNIDYRFATRIIDQHSVCYVSMIKTGYKVPMKNGNSDLNSDLIMEYVGIPVEPKPHIAINGAIWEAEAMSRLLNGKNLLPEFKSYLVPDYLKKN